MRRDFSICQPSGSLCSEAGCVPTELKTLRESLVQANLNLMDTKQSLTQLGHNLSDVRRGLEQTLSDSTCRADPVQTTCNDIRSSLGLVNVSINPDQVTSVTWRQGRVTGTAWGGLSMGSPIRYPGAGTLRPPSEVGYPVSPLGWLWRGWGAGRTGDPSRGFSAVDWMKHIRMNSAFFFSDFFLFLILILF